MPVLRSFGGDVTPLRTGDPSCGAEGHSPYLCSAAPAATSPTATYRGRLRRDGRPHLEQVSEAVGDPRLRFLAESRDRLSARQLELARANVPGATFRKADLSTVDLPEASADAVTAFYSMTHVPRERHADVLGRVARWLRPGGFLLLTLSARGETDGVHEFCGVPMFFSGYGPETNRQLLSDAGFSLLLDELVTMQEPDTVSTFQWVLASKLDR